MSIYKTQTFAPIVVDTEIDISAATTKRIYYKKPSGTNSYWTATLEGTTKLKFQPTQASDIDETGEWTIQGYCVIDGRDAFTDEAKMVVKTPLKS